MKKTYLLLAIFCSLLFISINSFATANKGFFALAKIYNFNSTQGKENGFILTQNSKSITFENLTNEAFNIKIYDEQGKLVFSLNSNKKIETIDTSRFLNGRYFYFATNNKGQHVAGHFNIEAALSLVVN